MPTAIRISKFAEQFRVFSPFHQSSGDKHNGMFMIKPHGLAVIASTGDGWDHVSVSRKSKMPTWDDMHWARQNFFSSECTVMQVHPPLHDHVNVHPYCLHLWRPLNEEIPRPPKWMIA